MKLGQNPQQTSMSDFYSITKYFRLGTPTKLQLSNLKMDFFLVFNIKIDFSIPQEPTGIFKKP